MDPSQRRIRAGQIQRLLPPLAGGAAFYQVLADTLREHVLSGRLPLAARLPAERELARELGISRTTVTAAYERLRTQGYAESRHGSGTLTCVPKKEHLAGPWSYAGAGQIDLSIAAAPATSLLPEAVEEAVHALPRYVSGSGYHLAGLTALRQAIARSYARRGVATVAEQIMVTCGTQHALALLCRELITRADPLVVEVPTYPHAMSAARREGARLVPVGMHPEQGWDLELFATAARQAAARLFYLIPEYQNPTGHMMDTARREAAVAMIHRLDAHAIVDEVHAGFGFDSSTPPPPMASFDREGRIITIGGLSKLAWGGLRLGWIRTSAALVDRLVALRGELDTASPVFEQLMAIHLLDRFEELAQERQAFVSHRDALVTALHRALPAWNFRVPNGGLSLWVELDAAISTSLVHAAADQGVHIVPGSFFGADGLLESYLRLPYMHEPNVLQDAVSRLATARQQVQEGPAPAKTKYRAVV